ncbi:MAG: sugar-transfer associated ATP-grasp domain-containing protein [Nitrospirota bacterium]
MNDFVGNKEKLKKLKRTKNSLREVSIPFVREGEHTPRRSLREWLRGWKMESQELRWIISGAPWLWLGMRNDGSPSRYIHRAFCLYAWRQSRLGFILMGAVFIAGIPVVLGMMVYCTMVHGARVHREVGKNPLRQMSELLALWLTKGILPFHYYTFDLYRAGMRRRALDYLYRHETKRGLYLMLREHFPAHETRNALSHKALFAQRCQQYGVAVVPALFTVKQGELTRFDLEEAGLPPYDLFLKPVRGAGGRGAEVWTYLGDRSYRNASAGTRSEAELLVHLINLSRRKPYVGRLLAANHPELAAVSSGALCTIRVLTCLDENNRPEVTDAVLRMPRTPGIVVDNFHAGGIAAKVMLENGMIGAATGLGQDRHTAWFENHPTTGAVILGRQVPMWPQVLDLARQVHSVFPDQFFVGWDIAVLETGPHLIEGNKGPDLDIIQRTGGEPIGNSRFGALLAYHLRQGLEKGHSVSIPAARPSAECVH